MRYFSFCLSWGAVNYVSFSNVVSVIRILFSDNSKTITNPLNSTMYETLCHVIKRLSYLANPTAYKALCHVIKRLSEFLQK